MLEGIDSLDPKSNLTNVKHSSVNIVTLSTQQEAQTQAFADASTSGARFFLCHIYQQGGRNHIAFSLPFNLLLEMARLHSADAKKNKSNVEEMINRPLVPQHVEEIARYLVETENYILPPFIFNANKPIKVFCFGTDSVRSGYAVISSNVELYVTDGQHRLKAIEKAIIEKQELRNDSVMVLVVQEDDIDQIHQDFADCAKNKPIPPALLAVFDVSNVVAKLTRELVKESVIFNGRINKIANKTVGKDPNYLFTMNQLRVFLSEFLFGSSRKQVIESRSTQQKSEFRNFLEKAKTFYIEFAKANDTWKSLTQESSKTINIDLHNLRQERVDFNTVGFQIISKIGHLIFFGKDFTPEQQHQLIAAVAALDYSRESDLWLNNIVIEDDKGGTRKIVSQMAAIDKGFRAAVQKIEENTGIQLK